MDRYIKQLLNEVKQDMGNYYGRGLCYVFVQKMILWKSADKSKELFKINAAVFFPVYFVT